jgi:hypothetical protein
MDELERPIVLEDELNHTPYGAQDWRENWWLCFFDHHNGIRGVAYGGVQPGLGVGHALFALFLNDRPLFVRDRPRVGLVEDAHAQRRTGPLQFTCLEPMQRWRVTGQDGDASCDLEWTAAHRAYDWCWAEQTRSRHYEQPGRVTGRVTVGDRTFEIDGWGQRDKAWGHRADHALRHAWSSRVIFDENHLQHASAITIGEKSYLFGYVVKDGAEHLIDRLDLRPDYAYEGGPPLSTGLQAWAGGDLLVDQQVRLSNIVPRMTLRNGVETHQFFTFSRWFDGRHVAAGQLDFWWSQPYGTGNHLSLTDNDGVWVHV